jgi:hypothetical protein
MLRGDSGADRRREQKRCPLGFALVPFLDQSAGVCPHLRIKRALRPGLLLDLATALIFHFAAVEAHGLNGRRAGGTVNDLAPELSRNDSQNETCFTGNRRRSENLPNCREGLMRVEVAIFLEVDRAASGALGRIIPRIPSKSPR